MQVAITLSDLITVTVTTVFEVMEKFAKTLMNVRILTVVIRMLFVQILMALILVLARTASGETAKLVLILTNVLSILNIAL